VVKSVGYRSSSFEGVPFDENTATIPNEFGCVIKEGE
jgi:hypothetical protein